MGEMKPIETYCDGFRFRSRLEARWYIAFKTWNANLKYETEGYDLGNGVRYLPDFLIRNVVIVCHPDDYPSDWGDPLSPKDIYFEPKGNMTERDSEKILRFCNSGNKVFPIGDIPNGDSIGEVINDISNQHAYIQLKNLWRMTDKEKPLALPFSGGYCGVDTRELIPCALKDCIFEFGLVDLYYEESILKIDIERTMEGYNAARQARFEYGEHGLAS